MNISIFLIKRIVLLSTCLFVCGCASIISPSKGPNILSTEPSGADVYDSKNVKLGSTPLNLSTIPQNTQELLIKKDGYRESEISIHKSSNNTLLFVDAMLLCIPCPFDLVGNKAYSISPINPTMKLRKELPEKDNSVRIALGEISMDAKNNSVMKINSHPKKAEEKGMSYIIGDISDANELVKKAFNKTYLDAISANQTENIKSGMARPKILIKPVITDLSFDLSGKMLSNYSGNEKISCNWNIYKISDKNKIVGSVSTTTDVFRNSGSLESVLDQVMVQSAFDLLENDTLYDYLIKIEKEYMSDTKGSPIKITSAATPKYETLKDLLKNSKPAVVTVLCKDGFGSGFIISNDGYIITNYHVIKDEKNITVKLNADLKMKASLVKSNRDYDLALLKIEAEDLKVIPVGNSDNAEVGDEVYAIGTPLETTLGQTITKGIISGDRLIGGMKFIQTDVSINPGNSGGPLLNEKGEMIGVTTMKIAGEGIEGIGFCIPSNTVIEMLNIKF